MLKKFLQEIIMIVAGKPAEGIVDLLDSKKHVSEFIISKKLDITINQTRNILYKISDHGLISSIRKKDKKKGWYTYFWKIEILKSLEFLRKILMNKIGQINHQIKSRETKEFYICERCNIEFNEENALLHNFTCSECGNVFSLKDNTKLLRDFKKNLDRLRRELVLVENEIKKEKEKLEKKRAKEAKMKKISKKLKTRAPKNIKEKPKKRVKTKKKTKKKQVKRKTLKGKASNRKKIKKPSTKILKKK